MPRSRKGPRRCRSVPISLPTHPRRHPSPNLYVIMKSVVSLAARRTGFPERAPPLEPITNRGQGRCLRPCRTDRGSGVIFPTRSGVMQCGSNAGVQALACGSGHGRRRLPRSPDGDPCASADHRRLPVCNFRSLPRPWRGCCTLAYPVNPHTYQI
jgi:hypothetical protein